MCNFGRSRARGWPPAAHPFDYSATIRRLVLTVPRTILLWSCYSHPLPVPFTYENISRIYSKLLTDHFNDGLGTAFIVGSRQVGKTTLARNFQQAAGNYLSWDNEEHRRLILKGPCHIADYLGLQ